MPVFSRRYVLILCLGFLAGCSGDSGNDAPGKSRTPTKPVILNSEWVIARGNQALTGSPALTDGDSAARDELVTNISASMGLVWTFAASGSVTGTPVVAEKSLFVGSAESKMYAISLDDGSLLWSFDAASSVEGSAAIDGESLFFGTGEGRFFALDSKTGNKLWRIDTEGRIAGGVNFANLADGSRAVLFGCYNGKLYCIHSRSGEKIWEYTTGNYINGTPAVHSGKIYFGGCDSYLRVLDLESGREIFSADVGSYLPSSPAVSNNYVVAPTYSGSVICFSTADFSKLWSFEDPEEDPLFLSSPAISGNTVVIGSRNAFIYAIALDDGKLKWKSRSTGEIYTSAIVAEGRIAIFASKDGRVHAMDMQDGKKIASYDTGEAISASPAMAEGKIIIGSEAGTIFALELLVEEK